MSWSLLLIIIAVVLIGTAFYSVTQQDRFIREFTADVREVVDEAVLVRKDLEAAMENALLVSQNMAKTLDDKLSLLDNAAITNESDNISDSRSPSRSGPQVLPFNIEDLRRAHPYLVVPRLYEQGFNVQEIAQMLERSQGEINLILNLQRKREACS